MAYTQAQMRTRVLQEMGMYLSGTADATVDVTHVQDATLAYLSEKEKIGHWLYISSGGGGGISREARKITDLDLTTNPGRFTVATAFSAAPAITDGFIISPWQHTEIQSALNNGLLRSGVKTIGNNTSESWAANTYVYTVPVAIQDYEIFRVEVQGSPSDVYISSRRWKRVNKTDLAFGTQYTSGRTIRIWYRYTPDAYSTDTSSWTIEEDEADLIVAWSAVYLLRLLYQRWHKQNKEGIQADIGMWMATARDRQRRYLPLLGMDTQVIRSWM